MLAIRHHDSRHGSSTLEYLKGHFGTAITSAVRCIVMTIDVCLEHDSHSGSEDINFQWMARVGWIIKRFLKIISCLINSLFQWEGGTD